MPRAPRARMRLMTIPKVLLVGVAGAYALHRVRSRTRSSARVGIVPPPDPADPVQELYSETDFAIELDTPSETTLDTVNETVADIGDLYGIHTAQAEDVTHPDDDVAMRQGQNWLEALQTDAVEGGLLPEHEIESGDELDRERGERRARSTYEGRAEVEGSAEVDRAPHTSDTWDTPVADRGSGGPAGT